MRLRFCGVRGSTPATGADFDRVGGNTSCIAVYPNGSPVPTVVLDAGTGLRFVTDLIDGGPFVGTILLSHLHWDHVQGIPFFRAGDRPDSSVRVKMPDNGAPGLDTMAQVMTPPHFPIRPDELQGAWRFDAIGEGSFEAEGVQVLAREVPHKGGRTYGYRLTTEAGSVAYIPDHRPATSGPGAAAAEALAADVDVLIHNAQFTEQERAIAELYGHSTVDEALDLAARCRVRELHLFHHSPTRTDQLIDGIVSSIPDGPAMVAVACEGDEITL